MTLDELFEKYHEAWSAVARQTDGDRQSAGRAGVTAIIRALRDEIWMRTKRMDACDILLEILGPIEGEGAAKESGGRDRKYGPAWVGGGVPSPTYHISAADWWAAFMNARIVVVHGSDAGEKVAIKETAVGAVLRLEAGDPPAPATDAAPACEWRVGKDPAGYSCYYSDCTTGWRGLRANFCPTCKRPVKIVEPEPDPAPAVCVWTGEEYVTYSTSCESEHEVDPHKAPPTYCPSCGKPIAFTEANHG